MSNTRTTPQLHRAVKKAAEFGKLYPAGKRERIKLQMVNAYDEVDIRKQAQKK